MKKSILTLCLLGLFAITTSTTQAQIHASFNLTGGFPLNEFQEQNPNVGVGGNINVFFPFAPSIPVYIGFDLGFMGNGSRTNTTTSNLELKDGAGNIAFSFPISFDIQTSNSIFNGHAILKAKIPLPLVQPYVEGLVGFKSFSTRVAITDVRGPDSGSSFIQIDYDKLRQDSKVNTTVLSSTALSYGIGGGFQIMFGGGQFGLNIGARYLNGGSAEYYTREDIRGWTASFNTSGSTTSTSTTTSAELNNSATPRKSRTDMIFAHLGFVISF